MSIYKKKPKKDWKRKPVHYVKKEDRPGWNRSVEKSLDDLFGETPQRSTAWMLRYFKPR